MPPDSPREPFLFLNRLQTSSAKKTTLEKNVKIMPPYQPPFKISRYATGFSPFTTFLIFFY